MLKRVFDRFLANLLVIILALVVLATGIIPGLIVLFILGVFNSDDAKIARGIDPYSEREQKYYEEKERLAELSPWRRKWLGF